MCWAITLTTNYRRGASEADMTRKLRDWHASVEKKLLGPYFFKRPTGQRLLTVSLLENVDRNAHFHMLARRPIRKNRGWALPEALLADCWREIVPSGTVSKLFADNPRGWVSYMAKEHPTVAVEAPIFSFDFWPARK